MKRRLSKKKLTALILAAAMTVSLCPAEALAADLTKADDEWQWGTMTMTYKEFYGENVTDASTFDAMSSATTTKYATFSNIAVADLTDDGYKITGVANVPVKLMNDASEQLKARVTVNENQSIAPAQYATVDANGVGKLELNVIDTVTDAEAVISTSSVWGEYEIDLEETTTNYLRNTRSDKWEVKDEAGNVTESGTFAVGSGILGEILTTSDGLSVGMAHMENIWVQPYEVAFSSKGNANGTEIAKLIGKTVTKITFITIDGSYVYDLGDGIYIKPAYLKKGLSAEWNDAMTEFTIAAADESSDADFTNGKISASYTVGSGRNKEVTSVLDAAPVSIGEAYPLSSAIPENTLVDINITSDNYADYTVPYAMQTWQEEQLTALKNEADQILEETSPSILTEHRDEAAELLGKVDTTAQEAAELIGELTTLVEEYKPQYGTMTMTYKEFYDGVVSNADTIDSVSSATTTKYTSFVNSDYTEPDDSGYNIHGVRNVPVKVYGTISEELKNRITFASEEDAVPSQYVVIDGNGIGQLKLNVLDTVTDAAATLSTSSHWGEYEIDIFEDSTHYLRNTRSDVYDSETGERFAIASDIMGAILTTSDNYSVAMTHMENIWLQTYELAFSTTGNANSDEIAKLIGKTVSKITFIVPGGSYVYDLGEGIYIKPSRQEKVTASFNSSLTEFTLSGDVEDFTNGKISVSYTVGSGRNAKTIYLLQDAVIGAGNTYTLTEAVPDKTVVAISIFSDNYADYTVNYKMLAWQRESLSALKEQADAILTKIEDGTLAAHRDEAAELLSDTNASAKDAAELMEELTELIEAAQKKVDALWPKPDTSAGSEAETKADTTKLQTAIDKAKALKEADYTADSWTALQTALTNAMTANHAAAKQTDVDAAEAALTAAINGLVKADSGEPGTETKGTPSALEKNARFTSNKNTYKVTRSGSDPTVAFVSTKNTTKKIVIPATVKDVNGVSYKVTSIAKNALKGNKKVTSITVGNNVTTIGANAFAGCTKLAKVTLGSGVTGLGKAAFSGDKKLAALTIKSKNLTKVGANALKNTKSNIKIKVPGAKVAKYKSLFKNKGQSKYQVTK